MSPFKLIMYSFLVAISTMTSAQKITISLGGGATLYTGDLDPVPMSNIIQNTGTAYQFFVRQSMKDRIALRINFNILNISASDDKSIDSPIRLNRNLSFQNKLVELSLLGEFDMIKWKGWSLYAAGGPAVFRHSPKAVNIVDGQLVELQSLGTEGQGLTAAHSKAPYKLLQFAIPLGGGMRQAITKQLAIQVEMLGRFTFTDYLDDVASQTYVEIGALTELNGVLAAQLADPWIGRDSRKPSASPETTGIVRGNPAVNDYYLSGTISVIYKLIGDGRSEIKCPVF